MIALTAIKKTVYAGQAYSPGDSFEARDESDAYVLTSLLKVARRDPVPEPKSPQVEPETAAPEETAEAPAAETGSVSEPDDTPAESEPEPPAPKRRTYRRRDLSSED